jgi:predicted metal-dependent RNase
MGLVLAGSGMCTGGRIVDHLRYGLEDPANDILFGYQLYCRLCKHSPALYFENFF